MTQTIALLTDFGTTDTYVGVMKAVMGRIEPGVQFIDLTHEIAPQNVTQAAFTLLRTYRYFAPGTIFLIVVDPGVGTRRRAIAAQAGGYTFIAPDNGVLSYTLAELGDSRVVELTNPDYQLTPVSSTFHGRDIFAPAAAHLANGIPIEQLGSTISNIIQLPAPHLHIENGQITGQVLYTDHFGNIITNIGALHWTDTGQLNLYPGFAQPDVPHVAFSSQKAVTLINGHTLESIQRFYGAVEQGDLIVIADSSGYLEIAVNGGSAAKRLNVSSGAQVVLRIGK